MINVIYKCTCKPTDQLIEVPARPTGSDLMIWMEVVTATIRMHHTAYSPHCTRDTMEYVKIPMDENAEGIGEKPTYQS